MRIWRTTFGCLSMRRFHWLHFFCAIFLARTVRLQLVLQVCASFFPFWQQSIIAPAMFSLIFLQFYISGDICPNCSRGPDFVAHAKCTSATIIWQQRLADARAHHLYNINHVHIYIYIYVQCVVYVVYALILVHAIGLFVYACEFASGNHHGQTRLC